jgi:hypothetical protein
LEVEEITFEGTLEQPQLIFPNGRWDQPLIDGCGFFPLDQHAG